MKTIIQGQTVGVHYVETFNDGTELDNSRTRGNPLIFKVGERQVINGFENAVVGMKIGETKTVTISPEEAYGPTDPKLLREMPRNTFPQDFNFVKGALVEMRSPQGHSMPATIASFGDENVTLDFNHPLSGKTLNFEIEVVETDTTIE